MFIQSFAPQVQSYTAGRAIGPAGNLAVDTAAVAGATAADTVATNSASAAMATNAGLNHVLSDILGARAQGGSNPAAAFAQANTAQSSNTPSAAAAVAAARTPVQNLMTFGGDRKTAVGTLIASGAKAENPKLGFVKDTLRKIVGGTKTVSKPISATQTIETKVKSKNFNLKALRLSTKGSNVGGEQTVRHVDFAPASAATGGKTAQVKDIGTVIAKGTPTRMIEQDIRAAAPGSKAEVNNSYFDPKTGQRFMQTTERANRIETDKMGLTKSHKDKATYRQIELMGADGHANQRYVFDYGAKSIRLESLNADGQVTSSQAMSKKTDYFSLVDRLSMNPPSAGV